MNIVTKSKGIWDPNLTRGKNDCNWTLMHYYYLHLVYDEMIYNLCNYWANGMCSDPAKIDEIVFM